MRWAWLSGWLWGLALAQGLYQGHLDHLEFVGPDCPKTLPTALEATLVVSFEQQGYLLGPELISSRLEGAVLTSPLSGQPQFQVRFQTPPNQATLEADLVLKTPLQGCSLQTAHLQLQAVDDRAASQWLELGKNEYVANLALAQGKVKEAAEAFARSQPLSQSLRGEVGLVWEQDTLYALTLERLGRGAEAFPRYQEAATHLAGLLGERDPNTLTARLGVVSTLIGLGRLEEALPLARALAAQTEQALGPGSLQTLNAQRNLTNVLNSLGQNEEALQIFRQIYARALETYGPSSPITFSEQRALAGGLLMAGYPQEARTQLLDLYQHTPKELGADHYETLRTLEELAKVSSQLKQPSDALKFLELAQIGWGKRLGQDNQTSLRLLGSRALILWQLGRRAQAKPLYAQTIEAMERLRQQPLPPEERRRLLSENLVTYQNYMLLLEEEGDLEELFRVSELVKGRTLLDTLASGQAVLFADLPAEAIARLEGYIQRFAALDQELLTAQEPQASQLLAQRLRLNQDYAQYQQTLEGQYPRYAQLNHPNLLGAQQATQVVPNDTAFVSYIDLDELMLILVITPHQLSAIAVSLPPKFQETVRAYRQLLSTPDGALGLERRGQRVYQLKDGSFGLYLTRDPPPPGAVRVGDWRVLSKELSRLLIEPVQSALATSQHLIISPDGPLAFLPFETLQLGGKLLLERYSLSYSPSLSVYAALQERARQLRQLPRSGGLLALGNPAYNPQVLPTSNTSRSLLNTLREHNFQWAALPGTAREVTAAAQILTPAAEVWTGAEASLSALQTLSQSGGLANYRYLLLAAHGFVNPDAPEEVAVLLSPSSHSDGVLDLSQVLELRLQSDLVILSACETGLGQQVQGEGVVGLAYAFYVAGNLDTVLTLWNINDASSSGFSPRLLEHLKAGLSPEEALRQTQLEFLHQPQLAHPAYWAAFVLY
ncbi:MAG: CHAT domain-containing protein [Thermaceae bacterium]|nr:CHAT domain-containing protein [Thermaceae bacterium]